MDDSTLARRPSGTRKRRDRDPEFEWDPEEDTQGDFVPMYNPVYESRQETNRQHWSKKIVADMDDRDWRIFREDRGIMVKGTRIRNPIIGWDELELPQSVRKELRRLGYREPTAIQSQTIPEIVGGRDVVGIAETGSGKTLGFVLPLVMKSYKHDSRGVQPHSLILVPTRELALQIQSEMSKIGISKNQCIGLVGGRSMAEQSAGLTTAQIVVATPGRLKDCLDRQMLTLSHCLYVVLDEADRMIDMGFEADVNMILGFCPQARQTVMFSATMNRSVSGLIKQYLREPVTAMVGLPGQAVKTVFQSVDLVGEGQKLARMNRILSAGFRAPIIVFVRSRDRVDMVVRQLSSQGHSVVGLHGGKAQSQREMALDQVKGGAKDILVATDVAGRGIDIKDVSMVINYDMSGTIEDYIHRIGRTGRAGRSGKAHTFVTEGDRDLFYQLRKLVENSQGQCSREFIRHEASSCKQL